MSVFFSLPTLTGAFCRLFSCLVSWQGNFYLNTTLIMVNRFKKTFIRIEELIYLSSVLHITLYKCLIACKGYCRLPFSHSLSALLLSLFKIISISLGHRQIKHNVKKKQVMLFCQPPHFHYFSRFHFCVQFKKQANFRGYKCAFRTSIYWEMEKLNRILSVATSLSIYLKESRKLQF